MRACARCALLNFHCSVLLTLLAFLLFSQAQEEVFGPVMAVAKWTEEADLLQMMDEFESLLPSVLKNTNAL